MQFRHKVVLSGAVPLVVAACLIAFVVEREGRTLAESQVAGIENTLLAAKQDELRVLVAMAITAVPELDRADRNEQRALKQLRDLPSTIKDTKGIQDVYFYIYNMDTQICLMNARHPDLERRPQRDLKDDQGKLVLPPLLEAASHDGGDFVRYRWPRPSQGTWEPKLGYVRQLPGRWMIGTGVYIGDIAEIRNTIQGVRDSSSTTLHETMILIGTISGLAILAATALGLGLGVSHRRLADAKLCSQMENTTRIVMNAEGQERARVSRFLHDEVMQQLVAARWDVETVHRELGARGSHAELMSPAVRALAGLGQTENEIRTLSRSLRNGVEGKQLALRIEELSARFSERTQIAVDVEAGSNLRKLSAEAETALYVVAYLALSNVERHAHAARIAIRIAADDDAGSPGIRLTVRDDGRGFDVAAMSPSASGGVGLLHMRDRIVAFAGGRFSIRSSATGTLLDAYLPDNAVVKGGDQGGEHDKA